MRATKAEVIRRAAALRERAEAGEFGRVVFNREVTTFGGMVYVYASTLDNEMRKDAPVTFCMQFLEALEELCETYTKRGESVAVGFINEVDGTVH